MHDKACIVCMFQVPLGVIQRNETRLDEMAAILEELHDYVTSKPIKRTFVDDSGTVFQQTDCVYHKILFGGMI